MHTDEQIRDDILDEIDFDLRIESTEIGVTVIGGAVTLHGTVDVAIDNTRVAVARELGIGRINGHMWILSSLPRTAALSA